MDTRETVFGIALSLVISVAVSFVTFQMIGCERQRRQENAAIRLKAIEATAENGGILIDIPQNR